jgi:hypothetical protein
VITGVVQMMYLSTPAQSRRVSAAALLANAIINWFIIFLELTILGTSFLYSLEVWGWEMPTDQFQLFFLVWRQSLLLL